MTKTAIITIDQAVRQGDTPAIIENIAVWHEERSSRGGDRHDAISSQLRRLAHALHVRTA